MKSDIILNARKLRKNMTDAEKKLWFNIRNKRFNDLQFRRQKVIGNYIVDFVCLKEKLVIEVDGGQHAHSEYDLERTLFLRSEGYTLLRFWNNEVLDNIEGVLEEIDNRFSPPPFPLPKG